MYKVNVSTRGGFYDVAPGWLVETCREATRPRTTELVRQRVMGNRPWIMREFSLHVRTEARRQNWGSS
jgi:hypothetical protein